jgi:uncharacterized membrane protein (DUF485 family)
MKKKIAFIALLLVILTGVFNTVLTFPQLQKEFVSKPFFSAMYNNIGLVISGPVILVIGVVIVAIYIWIKLGKRDND